jgi:hypothetical protein
MNRMMHTSTGLGGVKRNVNLTNLVYTPHKLSMVESPISNESSNNNQSDYGNFTYVSNSYNNSILSPKQ